MLLVVIMQNLITHAICFLWTYISRQVRNVHIIYDFETGYIRDDASLGFFSHFKLDIIWNPQIVDVLYDFTKKKGLTHVIIMQLSSNSNALLVHFEILHLI